MKKSEIYRLAQYTVIDCEDMRTCQKAEILRELIAQEDLALFCEKQEEEEKKTIRENQQYEAV